MPLGLGFGNTIGGRLSRKLSARMVGEGIISAPLAPITRQITAAMTGTGTVTSDLLVTKKLSGAFTGDGTIAATVSTAQFLLDQVTGATAAYSIRLLSSTYGGALVRIRRSSDNAEKDFYPDSNNELSLSSEDGSSTSLGTWIGANNGFVVTWYDQSGDATTKDITNSTASQQPQILASGALLTQNGKPKLAFDTSSIGNLVSSNDFTTRTGLAVYTIDNATTPTNQRLLFDSNDSNNYIFQSSSSLSFDGLGNEEARYSFNGASFSGYAENHSISDRSGTQTLMIFEYQSGDEETFNGVGYDATFVINQVQEIVIYSTDKTSQKADIESNINDFYSIY